MSKINGKELTLNQHSIYSDYLYLQNKNILKHNHTFGILVVIQHIIICPLFGVFLIQPIRPFVDPMQFNINYSPIFSACISYLFALIGFGLIMSYNKRLLLSGIGFTLLITLLSIQWYFLFNALWTRINIGNRGTQFNFDDYKQNIYLSNRDGPQSFDSSNFILTLKFQATLTQAIRCGLANSIAFSAILGRAGMLEAFIIALIGSFGYVLNKSIVLIIGEDYGHTERLFIFAGFMGLLIGLLLRSKQNNTENQTKKHSKNSGNLHSISLALLGTAFIWVFFPTFVMDSAAQTSQISPNSIYIAPLNIFYSLASSTITSIASSYIIHEKLMIRDFIYGSISGGIAVASASLYITNPAFAMLVGSVAGILQTFICWIQRQYLKQNNVITTVSFGLFGIQGLIGAFWSAIWRAVIINRTDGVVYKYNFLSAPVFEMVSGFISLGIGSVFGIVIGLFVRKLAVHIRPDQFDDYSYWDKNDGIHFVQQTQAPVLIYVSPIAVVQRKRDVKQKYSYL